MMKAWVIQQISNLEETQEPLQVVNMPVPEPTHGELLIQIKTCGICHTELDEIEGRTPPPHFPVVPGHQVIGVIEKHLGVRKDLKRGDRVGVAWIYNACGKCDLCLSGKENLCSEFIATGRDKNGGYADYMVVPEKFVFPIPDFYTDAEAAPLLCAGAIGYRALSLCNPVNGRKIGLTGFGASAHLVLKLVRYQFPSSEIYVFARSSKERKFALELGAHWSGNIDDDPGVLLDYIIDTTPVWFPVVKALEWLKPGGRLVINAIRKENKDIEHLLNIEYPTHLWMEKEIKSVANVTRRDVEEFIQLATEMKFKPYIEEYAFEDANKAILDIKHKHIKGGKVLVVNK